MTGAHASPVERFWRNTDRRGADDCWLYRTTGSEGYGRIRLGGRESAEVGAHRYAYELLIGVIPDGLQIDHLCRNRGCVNPAHMEPVTVRENLRRGETLMAANLAKTHCPKGHPYDEKNTRSYPSYPAHRVCRACSTAYQRRYRAARRAR